MGLASLFPKQPAALLGLGASDGPWLWTVPKGKVGQDQVSTGCCSPGAWVLGMAQWQEGAHLPRTALPGLFVAGRPAVPSPVASVVRVILA